MAGIDLVTVKELMDHVGIAMTVRYFHLVPEHKAQAVIKLDERFDGFKAESANQSAVVSPELKIANQCGFAVEPGTKPERFLNANRARIENCE
jgi:hypothetical protein